VVAPPRSASDPTAARIEQVLMAALDAVLVRTATQK
jgi:hypothetical protein